MGKLIFSIFYALGVLFGSLAHADEVTLVKNPGFEARRAQWTATGASSFTIESAAPLDGAYSAIWNASATGEFLRSGSVTIPAGLKGSKCSVEMKYLWDTGTSGHILMNVDDGASNVASVSLDPTTGGVPGRAVTSFECPTSGTLRFELESTANAAAITLDGVFVGSGRTQLQLSQASIYGTAVHPGTASCVWTTSATFANFAVDADCPTPTLGTNALAPATKVPGVRFSNLPPGRYEVYAHFYGRSGASTECSARLHDGTTAGTALKVIGDGTSGNGTSMSEVFTYTSSQSDITFQIQMDRSGSNTCDLQNDTTTTENVSFIVRRYPTSAAEAITLETSSLAWAGYHDSDCSWVKTTSTHADFPTADATCTFTETKNVNFGTVTSQLISSDKNPGIVFSPRRIGTYYVCAMVTSSQSSGQSGMQITDGTTVIAQAAHSVGTNKQTVSLCGMYSATSLAAATIRLQGGPTGAQTLTIGGASVVPATHSIDWSIFSLDQAFPTPVFTAIQNVMKGAVSGLALYSASIANSGTPTITRQDGSWIASLTDNGTGSTTLNITSGAFTSTPTCICTVNNGVSDNRICQVNSLSSPTAARFNTSIGGGAATDTSFEVMCVGPR